MVFVAYVLVVFYLCFLQVFVIFDQVESVYCIVLQKWETIMQIFVMTLNTEPKNILYMLFLERWVNIHIFVTVLTSNNA